MSTKFANVSPISTNIGPNKSFVQNAVSAINAAVCSVKINSFANFWPRSLVSTMSHAPFTRKHRTTAANWHNGTTVQNRPNIPTIRNENSLRNDSIIDITSSSSFSARNGSSSLNSGSWLHARGRTKRSKPIVFCLFVPRTRRNCCMHVRRRRTFEFDFKNYRFISRKICTTNSDVGC